MRATEFIVEGVAEGFFDQFRKKQQNYKGIDVSVEKEDNNILVKATANGRELGRVLFTPSEQDDNLLVPLDLEVDERYRGQGIGATMYDYVKSLGYTIRRSQYQTDAGAGFWDKHKSGKNVWEQGVAEGVESLDYQGNCTEDEVVDEIFGDVNNFARMVEEHGDEFTVGKLVVKYDPETDIHSFYYKKSGVAEGSLNEFTQGNGGDDGNDLQLYLNVAKKLNMKKYKPSTAHNLIAKKMAELVDVVDDDKVDYARHMARKEQGLPNMLEQGVAEGFSNDMSTEDMIAYLRQHHDTNLHQDYLNHVNTFSKFVLKDIPTNTLKTDLPGLDREKVERYKKMDQSKAPPIVLGGKYILDGYHRANAVKELGIPTIKAYVGITTK